MNQHNKKQKLLLALPIIAAIAILPIVTNEVFAQDASSDLTANRIQPSTSDAITDVKVADPQERKAHVKFRGGTDGWAIIGGEAFPSKIGLTGTATHQGNGIWKVMSEGEIKVGNRHAKLDLNGKAYDGKLALQGTGTLEGGEPFRIFLRAHFAPVFDQSGDFVVAFTAAKVYNLETGVKIPLIQHGIVHVESVDPTTGDLEKLLDDFDVE